MFKSSHFGLLAVQGPSPCGGGGTYGPRKPLVWNSTQYFWFMSRNYMFLNSISQLPTLNPNMSWKKDPCKLSWIWYLLSRQVCRLLHDMTRLNVDLSTNVYVFELCSRAWNKGTMHQTWNSKICWTQCHNHHLQIMTNEIKGVFWSLETDM